MDTAAESIERAAYLRSLSQLVPGAVACGAPPATARLLQEAEAVAFGINERDAAAGLALSSPLANIFNRFRSAGAAAETFFPAAVLRQDAAAVPLPDATRAAGRWPAVRAELAARLAALSPEDAPAGALLRLLELYASCIPAVSGAHALPDVSFYSIAKLTAALAACLALYRAEHPDACGEATGCADAFLLVAGDLSGVQDFLYAIPTAGALKSLRGRSFYLDLLLEQAADEILSRAGVSRSCLLYAGGGHFYLLLPQTDACLRVLRTFAETINGWFLQRFGARLYLALAWTPCSADEFRTAPAAPYRRLSRALAREKLGRYTPRQLRALFHSGSAVNRVADGARECGVCRISSGALAPYGDASPDTLACPACRGLYRLGGRIPGCDAFLVSTEASADAVPLPGYAGERYLSAVRAADVAPGRADVVRLYVKNQALAAHPKAAYLRLADTAARDADGRVLEFERLAEASDGIRRLGVLRADVDNLGAAFLAGFSPRDATLSRTAALSAALSAFFRHDLPLLCAEKPEGAFSLFGRRAAGPRCVHVVYAGGDDLFLVGAWDEIVETAVDLRRAFRAFTNGKLTFSAGIGLFPPDTPVPLLAAHTGRLEDAAKALPGKDGVALFGAAADIRADTRAAAPVEAFSWQAFEDDVVGEKLRFLQRVFARDAAEAAAHPERLRIGRGALHRFLGFLAQAEGDGGANLARFAYALARLEPSAPEKQAAYHALRTTLYGWYMAAGDRRALRAAAGLLSYHFCEQEAPS